MSFFMVFFGILWALVGMGMFGVWVGMELSFIGVIGFLGSSTFDESESLIKYFIIQVIGSSLLMVSIMFLLGGCFLKLVEFIFLLGMFLKLGLFPFHFWVPSVVSGMAWLSCFLVLVVQKVVPVWMLGNFCVSSVGLGFLEIGAILTCLVGCVGGLMILHFRVLLGYSSLVHLGFMVVLSVGSLVSFFVYYVVYLLISFGMMVSLYMVGVYSFVDVVKWGKDCFIWLSFYLLSLAGVPPFLGSFLKVIFLLKVWGVFPLVCGILLVSSAVSMYFYLSFFFSFFFSFGGGGFFELSSLSEGRSEYFLLFFVSSMLINICFSLVTFSMVGLL